jgi:hypothetical protein
MRVFWLCFFVFAVVTTNSYAQNSAYKKQILPKPIKTEFSIGARLNSDGWSGLLERGKIVAKSKKTSDKFYSVRVLQLEIGERKSPQEFKITNSAISIISNETATPYIYGKINNFYTVKLGYGYRKLIAGKPEEGTVSIHWLNMGGLSVGLLKPYYVDAYTSFDSTIGPDQKKSIKYDGPDKASFLNQFFIVGASGFSKGLSEIKMVPGIFYKTGLHFDFANSRKMKLAAEAGLMAEMYSQSIKIMASDSGTPYFVSLYVGIQFGKRW